jgi:2',3'-cyclic-nucleotide 2'-phosphodiesterase/3'-nucleotidase
MQKLLRLLLSATILLAAVSCTQLQKPEKLTIKIIETSDVHGAIMPYDLKEDHETDHSLAQVLTYVNQERANPDQVVIFLDNGDILQGDPIVYYFNFENTESRHICSEVMNYMGYDAATVGNHDIEPGHAVYDKLDDEFDFPWLAANALETESGEPYFKPYVILERQGVKIAILGLITPAIPQWLPENIWAGMEFRDMIESAKYWTEKIRKEEDPDVMIGLFHAGADYSYNMQEAITPKNENASKLVAEQVPGFDVVFVGHDHHGWNEKLNNWAGNEVLLLGPTSRARNVAVAEVGLTLNKTTNHYQKTLSGELVAINEYAPDSGFIKNFTPQFEEAKTWVASPVGSFTEAIDSREAFFSDSPFIDLIHQAQLDISGAQISFAAPLSFDMQIDAGEFYVRDMFKLYRFENLLYTMELGGVEIKDFLEYSYNLWLNQMENKNDHLINFKVNEDGELAKSKYGDSYQLANAYYNFDSGDGLIYTVDVSMPFGERVNISSLSDGTPFDLNNKYTVAVNSYRGNGGGNHLIAGSKIRQELLADRIVHSTEKDLRYHMMEWLKEKSEITPSTNNNWKIIPEEWVEPATPKDYILLFGAN